MQHLNASSAQLGAKFRCVAAHTRRHHEKRVLANRLDSIPDYLSFLNRIDGLMPAATVGIVRIDAIEPAEALRALEEISRGVACSETPSLVVEMLSPRRGTTGLPADRH